MTAGATQAREADPVTSFPVPERFGGKRRSILRVAGRKKHRYRLFRGLTQIFSLVMLALVPGLGIARFDLFGDGHAAWFEAADFTTGLIAVGIAIFSFYLFTFLINLVAGRMFCGWGCPVGQLNRLTDTLSSQNATFGRVLWGSVLVGFALLLCVAVGTWWAPIDSLWRSSTAWMAWAGLLGTTASALIFARQFGWRFCERVCPIGLYYSVVQQRRPIGIQFDRGLCQDDGACVRACPVALDPRQLSHLKDDIGGFAIDGLASNNHCLRCGACVEACEIVTVKRGAPALSFGRAALPVMPTSDLIQISRPEPMPSVAAAPLHVEASPAPVEAPTKSKPVSLPTVVSLATLIVLAVGATAFVVSERQQKKKSGPTVVAPTESVRSSETGSVEGSVMSAGQPVADAVVVIRGATAPKFDASPRTISIVVENSAYAQPVYLLTTSDRITPDNRDSALHTFHISSKTRTVRNRPLPAETVSSTFRAPKAGTYQLFCDTHESERATLVVVDHPYAVRTSIDGTFVIPDVPTGHHSVEIHGPDNSQVVELEVTAGEPNRIESNL